MAVLAMVALVSSGCAWVQRVSVDSAGGQGDNYALLGSISANGRYVVFHSYSTLVAGDTNGALDVFVRDTAAGTTTRVSVGSGGTEANATSYDGAISADGRYVAFTSFATNLVAGNANNTADLFVRDTVAGTTRLVSIGTGGTAANHDSFDPVISADGRYVAFDSYASNLVAGDTNNGNDVFIRDTLAQTTTRVSVAGASTQADGFSEFPGISADGRYVAFTSSATNLVVGDTNNSADVFVRDTVAGTTTRISVGTGGTEANAVSFSTPSVSADGRYVAFDSEASNLVAGDTNGWRDVFVRDTVAGTTRRVSVTGAGAGTQAADDSSSPAISADGRYVAFSSLATDLVAGDTNNATDVFVRDTVGGTTTRVSVTATGIQANGVGSYIPAISADGRYIAFNSAASNLVAGDTNNEHDVVVRANPQAAVTGITPSTLAHGATTPVTVTGSGFIPSASVVVDGPGITVSAVTAVSPTEITANVTVDAGATLGVRNVWVKLPGTGPGWAAGAAGLCLSCATVS